MSRVLIALASLALSACAVQSGSLPERAPESLVALSGVSTGYEVQARIVGIESAERVGYYRSRVEPLLPRVFESVSIGPGKAPLYLRFKFDNTTDPEFNTVTYILCALTLTAFPGYAQADYTLDLEAEWEGKLLETRHYETTVKTLVWLPLFPIMLVRTPGQVGDDAVDELITNALADLSVEIKALPEARTTGE